MEELLDYLNAGLREELPDWQSRIPSQYWHDPAKLFHALVNIRPPWPASAAWLAAQDQYLRELNQARGRVDAQSLPDWPSGSGWPGLALWQGDILTLAADAIVNAANSSLLGCVMPLHLCIDNVIQTAAGVQLRLACQEIIRKQGHPEPVGQARLTPGFNLHARYVLHTVGPQVRGRLTEQDCRNLAGCYHACLQAAEQAGLRSLVFCGISTGAFRFPKPEAARIALDSISAYLAKGTWHPKIIINVFSVNDYDLYARLLSGQE